MACEYYKNCSAYDVDKDVCADGHTCKIYDQLFNEHNNRRTNVSCDRQVLSSKVRLELIIIDQTIKVEK